MPVPDILRRDDERGFTLIELMVVILIIAILLAIAVPTFLGARERAADRAAQSNVRNGHVTQLIIYADKLEFTQDTNELSAAESSLIYSNSLAAMNASSNVVYVEMLPPTAVLNDTVVLGSRSSRGRCFWIRTIGGVDLPRFADNDCSVVPPAAEFRDRW